MKFSEATFPRLLAATLLTFFALSMNSALGEKSAQPLRLAVATFMHETCTFCPNPTTIEDWEFYGPPTDDVLNIGNKYIKGFVKMSQDLGGIELVGITSPRRSRGGSSGSWVSRESFDKYTGLMAEDLKKAGQLDGLYLALHGAMAVDGIPKPEAEIVRRLRKIVGDIPIMVTLDLHANEDHELADAADAVLIVKRYPHYDSTLQGERTARLMIQTIKGSYTPTMATRKPNIITPTVFQGTGVSPAMEIMDHARRWEERLPGVYVSVAFGFPFADVPTVGATVMVITNNDQQLADDIAQNVSDYIWRHRKEFAGKKLPKTSEGVSQAIAAVKSGNRPVIIADHADRTGGSSHILEALIQQRAQNFCIATLRDEKALKKIIEENQVGDRVVLQLGGYSDKFAGNPVSVNARVEFLGTYGKDPIVRIGFGQNNHVIITPHLRQVTSTGILTKVGLDINDLDIIALKSRVHFRRGFYETGIAGAIIEIDAPGWGPADLSQLEYQNIPTNLYPLHVKD